MNDTEKKGFFKSGYGETMPTYDRNPLLQAEYNVLVELGYKISTEEMQLMNGTHELYVKDEEK